MALLLHLKGTDTMATVTRADLDQILTVLNRYHTPHGITVTIEWAYGKPRAYWEDDAGVHELSPRLSKAALYQWLSAYEEGLNMASRMAQKS